jgi:hypothetical protein
MPNTATIAYLPHVSPKNNNTAQMRRRVTDLVNAVNNTIGSSELNTGQLGSLQTQLTALQNELNGGITFPTQTGTGSISGKMLQVTSPGTANTEFVVVHNLGRVPQGYIVFWTNIAASIYQGPTTGTAWTTSNMYLKANEISVTMQLFVT